MWPSLSATKDSLSCLKSLEDNACYDYAVARTIHYRKGKKIELLANYEPKFHFITEWWKQLYGESEGKENKGIFPAGVDYTTDLQPTNPH